MKLDVLTHGLESTADNRRNKIDRAEANETPLKSEKGVDSSQMQLTGKKGKLRSNVAN